MCEIAITNGDSHSAAELTNIAMRIYESQKSSLGIVAIKLSGGEFGFGIYKSLAPEPDDVEEFFDHNDDSQKFIIHGRMATHGGRDLKSAHPIQITCDKTDVDYVLHNGIIPRHKNIRKRTESEGHEYHTDVDSEVIAHKTGKVPEEFEEREEQFDSQPGYILLSKERVFINNGGKYEMTEDGRMQRSYRKYGFVGDSEDSDFLSVILFPEE